MTALAELRVGQWVRARVLVLQGGGAAMQWVPARVTQVLAEAVEVKTQAGGYYWVGPDEVQRLE